MIIYTVNYFTGAKHISQWSPHSLQLFKNKDNRGLLKSYQKLHSNSLVCTKQYMGIDHIMEKGAII